MMGLHAFATAPMPWKKSASGTAGMDMRDAERCRRAQFASGRKKLGRLRSTR